MHRPEQPLRAVLALLLALALSACATTPPPSLDRETDDLALVADDAVALAGALGPNRVLVVFDIDNTLLAMEQGLGSDQWYEWQKALAAEQPCGPQTVPDRFAVQGAMYFASAMRLTQPDAAVQVRRMQDAGMSVIALTSRGVDYRLQTFRELRRNGFDFRRSALDPVTGWPNDFTPTRGSRLSRYEDGVFLTSGQHKGEMLLELLERTGSPLPATVVAADDKRSNLDAMIESLQPLGVTVQAWRYTGEDVEVAAFDPDAAHRQWEALRPALRTLQKQLGLDNFELPMGCRQECVE